MNENIWYSIDEKVMSMYRQYCVKANEAHYRKLFRQNGIKVRKLTGVQKKEINDLWKGKVRDFSTHEFYYTVTGEYNPLVCSEMLFRKDLEPMFNNQNLKRAWGDKNYLERFVPGAPFPHAYLRAVGGGGQTNYYDENDRLITKEAAVRILKGLERFVIKPSIDNGLGKGVKICEAGCDIDALFNTYKSDFVVQEVIRPHSSIAKFGPKAAGIFRVTTCRMSGASRFLSASLRINEADVPNDNYISKDGRGMVVIGANNDGVLKNKGYYSCGVAIEQSANGETFGGTVIPSFELMKETVVRASEKLGHFGFAGWDVTIDQNEKPVILEYNIRAPGVLYYQYTTGPLFGEYTDEIIRTLL